MIVYESKKSIFLDDAFKRDIEEVILEAFRAKVGRSVARSEIQSWKESLLAIARVLNDDSIPADCGVAIEYGIPQTSKRIDIILSGIDAKQTEQLIIVELKQWQSAIKTAKDGIVRTRFAGGEADVSHPSYQAWSYASLLSNFNEAVYEDDVALSPCAYLHNYIDDGALTDAFYERYLALAPVFLKGAQERARLQSFIKKHMAQGDQGKLIGRIERGRIRPSKGLIDALVDMFNGRQEFVLIDDQKVVYETALELASNSSGKKKQVVIIVGGPGTGKSVVAINLLVALTTEGRVAKYVSKNAAPRRVMEWMLAGQLRKVQLSGLFGGSGEFVDSDSNAFHTLVVDEAHRLNEKSGLYGNLGVNQIAEVINAAQCAIFFIDDNQRVTFKDIGTTAEIARIAVESGASVTTLELESQFRCNGSNGYLAWLDNILEIRTTANECLDGAEFDFQVFNSPAALRSAIVQRNKERNKARMVAGYCWDWKSKADPKAKDVVFPEYDFAMQWNLTKDGGLWMVAPDSVNEIGCIHTCQGLEADYIGVIVGPDLLVRDGRVVTVPEGRSKHDKSLSGYKSLLKQQPDKAKATADLIIKNTYRTLMTRGMRGCYVYFTDKETSEFVRSRVRKSADEGGLRKVAEPYTSYD